MKRLQKGDRIRILPTDRLIVTLQMRNFCFNDETRQRVAQRVGGKTGIVENIEEKYEFDYFYFLPDGENQLPQSLPYQAVDFS